MICIHTKFLENPSNISKFEKLEPCTHSCIHGKKYNGLKYLLLFLALRVECRHFLFASKLQGDSKRWAHFVSLYGFWRLNTRQSVGRRIPSSLFALRVDLRGLRSKLS